MSKKLFTGLLMISLLFLTLTQLSHGEVQSSNFQGWQVENRDGYYSESDGVLRLRSDGGSDCPSITLYKQIKPTSDFTFSVQVNAQIPESCGVFIRSSLPIAGNTNGFNFEYGHYGEGLFLLARNSSGGMASGDTYGHSSNWIASQVAYGDPHVWYTMQLSVSSSPFRITTSVFDENGTSIGSFSTSDITNFTFDDINYIGLTVWGYSPSDYSFRNIQNPFDNPASLSISTESSSTTAGSAVNVFGYLMDSNGSALQNKTIVLSYTFPGANSWIPITSGLTNEQGEYNVQWINSASGTFTLKTEWSGDAIYSSASNTTTLTFLPYENHQVFLIESNSTVYAFAFNNDTSTLNFNVTGPSGSTGFVRATIAKQFLSNGDNLQVYLDGKQLNYSVTSGVDSWVLTFNYSHSTHQVSIHTETNASSLEPFGSQVILIVIVALFSAILAIEIRYWLRPKNKPHNQEKEPRHLLT